MTRALNAQQSPLRRSSHLVAVDLIHLITYTDRAADTVDTHFYFAKQAVRFDWENNGTDIDFWPVLESIGTLDASMNHLPSPDDTGHFRKAIEFTLSNQPHGDDRLINKLRSGHILENARVEWTQVLLADRPSGARIDLTALVGDEHTFWYRGRVVRVGPITGQSITFHCESEIPNPVVLKALDQTKNDPKDFGRRFPHIYGDAKRVKAVGYDVGWVTTLAETITDTATGNTDFTDVSGLSGSGITVKIGNEEVTATYVNDTTLNITARAQNSTTAQGHGRGEVALEMITTISFVVAGHEVDSIGRVFIRNPASGELVRIPNSGFTKTTANTTLISGETVATVSFTTAQLRTILEETFNDVNFAGENEVLSYAPQTRSVQTGSPSVDDQEWLTPGGLPRGEGRGFSGPTEHLRLTMQTGLAGGTREVVRWRLRLTANLKNVTTGGSGALKLHMTNSLSGSPGAASVSETAAQENFGMVAVGSWGTPTGGTTISDLEGEVFNCYLNATSPPADIKTTEYGEVIEALVEVEVAPAGTVELLGNLVGFNLELFANVSGYKAPAVSPVYKAGSGNMIEKPCDVLRHMIEVIGSGSIHTSSYDDCNTNLGTDKWGFDARTLGLTWEEQIARMAFEARANLIPEETATGTQWKMLTALSTYAFPAASGSVDDWETGTFAEADQDVNHVHASRFTFPYAPDWSKGSDEGAFTQLVVANEDTNDLTTPSVADFVQAAKDIGSFEAEPMAFFCIQELATAEEIAGYYAHERIRIPVALFGIAGVAWWEGYDLEVGDIISVTPPWASSAVKSRIISYSKDPSTEQIELRLVEVQ